MWMRRFFYMLPRAESLLLAAVGPPLLCCTLCTSTLLCWKMAELFADERCSGAILEFFQTTDVGREAAAASGRLQLDGSGATHPFFLVCFFIYCMRPIANTSFSPALQILLRSSSCGILIPTRGNPSFFFVSSLIVCDLDRS